MSQPNPLFKASFEFSGTLKEQAVCCYDTTDTTSFSNFFNATISSQLEIKKPKETEESLRDWVLLNCYFSVIVLLSFALALQRTLGVNIGCPTTFKNSNFYLSGLDILVQKVIGSLLG